MQRNWWPCSNRSRAVRRQGASIFPEAHSLELVRSIVGEEHSLEDVIDLEEEALAETGNVILNACLATIANVLHRTMRMSLPAVVRGNGDMLFGVGADIPRGNLVLFLYIDFAIKDRDIHGFYWSWTCHRSWR